MKWILKSGAFVLLATVLFYVSCKKEFQAQPNRPPIAKAGPDQTITLPTNTITLDGSASKDPDNNIISYLWTKISGPSSFSITDTNSVQTQVINLVYGVYQFELKVTDAGGLFSQDTILVYVALPACDNTDRPLVNAQLIPVGTLSVARNVMAVASAGNKILFAGGETSRCCGGQSRVDIYDITTQTWSTAELSVPRYDIAAVSVGNKIFFGGGETFDGTWPTNAVDIYDASTNTWSVTSLSGAAHGMAAATVGSKVFFAGGQPGFASDGHVDNVVDIYDTTTQTWSTQFLSEPKIGARGLSAVTVNNKVYFAGGTTEYTSPTNGYTVEASNKIDIYDNATNSWSTSTLIEGKTDFVGINVANKIYWAGGVAGRFATYNYPTESSYNSCVVEIRDVTTGNSSIQYLSKRWLYQVDQAVVKNNKIAFFRNSGLDSTDDNKFDIYDIATNTWSVGVLPINLPSWWASIISVNNIIYVAGGVVNENGSFSSQVWKLEF